MVVYQISISGPFSFETRDSNEMVTEGSKMVLEAGAISERILSLKEQNKALRCFILNNGLQVLTET